VWTVTDAIPLVPLDEDSYHQDPPGFFARLRESRPVAAVRMPADGRAWIVTRYADVRTISSANRDPAQFPGPDHLDLGRDTSGHVAFGHGVHHCLGAPLARMEAEVALGALLARFPRISLHPPESVRRPVRQSVWLPAQATDSS
jgi:cytochrome P450